jgi:hypothetical protein
VALAAELRVGYNVFKEAMAAPGTQNIWRGNQHAGRGDFGARIRDKNSNAFAHEYFRPDALGMVVWLRYRTHFRYSKEIEQPPQIGYLC